MKLIIGSSNEKTVVSTGVYFGVGPSLLVAALSSDFASKKYRCVIIEESVCEQDLLEWCKFVGHCIGKKQIKVSLLDFTPLESIESLLIEICNSCDEIGTTMIMQFLERFSSGMLNKLSIKTIGENDDSNSSEIR